MTQVSYFARRLRLWDAAGSLRAGVAPAATPAGAFFVADFAILAGAFFVADLVILAGAFFGAVTPTKPFVASNCNTSATGMLPVILPGCAASPSIIRSRATTVAPESSCSANTLSCAMTFRGITAVPPMSSVSMTSGSPTSSTSPLVNWSAVRSNYLGLDQPVDEWLPELAGPRVLTSPTTALDDTVAADHPVAVRHLLTNTSGYG